jgi:folylpolyglutamate synthase/dihydropteroate synthase
VRMGLIGRHQRDNAVTAAGAALALRQQGYTNISVASILAGLSRARLPGRFQVSSRSVVAPHTAVIGVGTSAICDPGH